MKYIILALSAIIGIFLAILWKAFCIVAGGLVWGSILWVIAYIFGIDMVFGYYLNFLTLTLVGVVLTILSGIFSSHRGESK